MGKLNHSRSRSRNKKSNKYRSDRESTSHNRKDKRRNRHYTSSSSSSRSSSDSQSGSFSSASSPSYSNSDSLSSGARKRHQMPHYKFRRGQKLNHRYKIQQKLGDGTFGRVMGCEYRGSVFAVKIIKQVDRYIDSARTQRSIIKKINSRDREDQWGIVRYVESFYHREHFCLVFKPLGKSLYDFIKMNLYKGFPIKLVQSFFRQILRSVGFLHRIGYTHTDLKPENILLQSEEFYEVKDNEYSIRNKYFLPKRDKVRIIDFGGATRYDEFHSSTINTRQYRSPEVILQSCKWDELSDVWSIGCIVCQLFTGQLLFPTHSDQGHLAMIEQMRGKFPNWMIQKTQVSSLRKLFRDGLINQDKIERIQNVIGLKTLQDLFSGYPELAGLIRCCLEIDPSRRINCTQALRHPFFSLRL